METAEAADTRVCGLVNLCTGGRLWARGAAPVGWEGVSWGLGAREGVGKGGRWAGGWGVWASEFVYGGG